MTTTAEQRRLAETAAGTTDWQRWGTYVSDRAWGTVREDYSADGNAWDYFPHDHAPASRDGRYFDVTVEFGRHRLRRGARPGRDTRGAVVARDSRPRLACRRRGDGDAARRVESRVLDRSAGICAGVTPRPAPSTTSTRRASRSRRGSNLPRRAAARPASCTVPRVPRSGAVLVSTQPAPIGAACATPLNGPRAARAGETRSRADFAEFT